jgi:hypothetical protein
MTLMSHHHRHHHSRRHRAAQMVKTRAPGHETTDDDAGDAISATPPTRTRTRTRTRASQCGHRRHVFLLWIAHHRSTESAHTSIKLKLNRYPRSFEVASHFQLFFDTNAERVNTQRRRQNATYRRDVALSDGERA